MTNPIIVVDGPVGREGQGRGTSRLSRPSAAAAELNPTRVTGGVVRPAGAREVVTVRISALVAGERIVASGKTRQLARIHFQSVACSLRADASGLRGFLLPAFRRWFNSFGAFEALRSLIPSLLIKPAKQPSGGFMKWFRSFSCAVRHVEQHDMRATHEIGSINQERGFFSQGETRV